MDKMEILLTQDSYERLEEVADEFELDNYSQAIDLVVMFFQKYRNKEWFVEFK